MANRRGITIAVGTALALVLAGLGLFLGRDRSGMASDFVVPDLQGNAVRLSALRGKVVFLNLWATWCPPCREEMPSMQRLYQHFQGRDFAMLAVSSDEQKPAVEAFVKEGQYTFPVLFDPQRQVGDTYGVWGYPETFLIDRTGKIVEHIVGPRPWDKPDQLAKIERLLAAPATPPD
jgi:peroxiredoxin